MNFFWKTKKSVFSAFDVGNSSIKAVSIDASGKNPTLVDVFCVDRNERHSFERLAKAYPHQKVSLSIPCSKVDIRFLNLPKVAERDLRKMVGLELESKLNYQLDEACYDYTESNGSLHTTSQKTNVVAFACRRSEVQAVSDRFLPYAFDVRVLDVLSMGLINAYGVLIPDFNARSYIGINVEERHATIVISQNGSLLFTRNFPIHIDADPVKGINDDMWIGEIATEIRRTVQYCDMHFHSAPDSIREVLISGGGMSLDLLCNFVTDDCRYSCRIVDPFDSPFWGSDGAIQAVGEPSQYVAAFGLVVRLSRETI